VAGAWAGTAAFPWEPSPDLPACFPPADGWVAPAGWAWEPCPAAFPGTGNVSGSAFSDTTLDRSSGQRSSTSFTAGMMYVLKIDSAAGM
jgi:hypothetical protein